ncbi:hypothetical protein D3C76_909250 [compost metagenome]
MCFEVSVELTAQWQIPSVPSLFKRFGHTDAVSITTGQCFFEWQLTCEYRRAEHGRGEAGAFLIRPHCNFQWALELDAFVLEAANYF